MLETIETFETRLFINNEYVDGSNRLTIHNPADNSIITSDVHVANEADVNKAVAAARKAFPMYSVLPPSERCRLLVKLADLIEANGAHIARLEALCGGKALSVTIGMEVPIASKILRCKLETRPSTTDYAGWCDKLEGESFPCDDGFIKMVRHEPLGVCAAITAFNSPLAFFSFKAGPCLATGNTLIVKSSEKTPLGSLYLGELVKEAGFPPGVVNFISGAGQTGSYLASHMDINKISFTGSVGVGKKIFALASASNLKRVTLELGGKSASIIFPDANLDVATQWCAMGATLNGGQVCIASSRVYVHEDIKDKFLARMKEAFEMLISNFGDPLAPTTTNCSLVDKFQYEKVLNYIKGGESEGTLLCGGSEPLFDKGCWVKPTIFVDTTPSAKVYKEEIFGPVVVINGFKDENEAIARANNTEYGLAGAVFTQDVNRAMRVAGKIQAGIVGINCCTMIDATVPLGGMKQSGQGRELGKYGLRAYTQPKTIFLNMTY